MCGKLEGAAIRGAAHIQGVTLQAKVGLASTGPNSSPLRHISPFRYPGGKTWLLPTAREWLSGLGRPQHLLEPFAGGGTVGLAVAAESLADRVTLVELDDDVAAVWQVLLHGSDRDVAALAAKVMEFAVTVENVRAIIGTAPTSTVGKAFRTIAKNRFQRGGVMARGAGLMREAGEGRGLAGRWYPETLVRRFVAIRGLREKVAFEHGDGLEAIERHRGATMFVDPPYTAGSGKRAGSRLYTPP